jgi:hypothetical protein
MHGDGHHHPKKPRMSAFGSAGAVRGAASAAGDGETASAPEPYIVGRTGRRILLSGVARNGARPSMERSASFAVLGTAGAVAASGLPTAAGAGAGPPHFGALPPSPSSANGAPNASPLFDVGAAQPLPPPLSTAAGVHPPPSPEAAHRSVVSATAPHRTSASFSPELHRAVGGAATPSKSASASANANAATFPFCNGLGCSDLDSQIFNGDGANINVDDFTAHIGVDDLAARAVDPLRRRDLTGGGHRGGSSPAAVERKLDQLIDAVATLATAQARLEDSNEDLHASMKKLLLASR